MAELCALLAFRWLVAVYGGVHWKNRNFIRKNIFMGHENIYNNNVLFQCVQNMLFDCWLIRMKMKNATSKNCNVFGEPLFASAQHVI